MLKVKKQLCKISLKSFHNAYNSYRNQFTKPKLVLINDKCAGK